jgi:hypothetical protein
MRNARTWLILVAVLVVLVGGSLVWNAKSWSRRIPGRYTAVRFDGETKVVFQFSSDGSSLMEIFAPGAAQPKSTVRGRWRLSGKVFILEVGAAASAPIGWLDSFTEQFEKPLLGGERSRFGLVSADETGLVLDIGRGLTWTLNRTADDP